jgi:chromosome partitioning protein
MAKRGWRTLLVDTDPQGSVGLSLSRRAQERRGFYDAVELRQDAAAFIQPTKLPELHILTSGQSQRFFDASAATTDELQTVARLFSDLDGRRYDLIIADTPAGMTGFTGHVLKSVDYVVVPQQAEPLGARSIPYVLSALRQLRASGHRIRLIGILLTMMQADSETCQSVVTELGDLLPAQFLLRDMVPRDPDFLEASARGVPVGLLRGVAPAGAILFDKLAADMELRMKLRTEHDGYDRTAHTPLMD